MTHRRLGKPMVIGDGELQRFKKIDYVSYTYLRRTNKVMKKVVSHLYEDHYADEVYCQVIVHADSDYNA